MKKKLNRILIVLLLVCFVSAPFASAQYTDSITVLGGLGGVSRDALEEMLDLVACKCTGGGGCECGGGGDACDCLCSCVKCAFLLAHPYGSVYMATDPALSTDTAMAAKFGGAWEAWGEGRVPVGVGQHTDIRGEAKTFAFNATGGTYSHALTVPEMPPHTHTFERPSWFSVENANNGYIYSYRSGTSSAYSGTTNSTGGSAGVTQAHNNVQPYVACYMWKRTDANPVPFVCPDAPTCPYCCTCGGGGGASGSCGCEPGTYVKYDDLDDYLLIADLKVNAPLYINSSGEVTLKTTNAASATTNYVLVSVGADEWEERGITNLASAITAPITGSANLTTMNTLKQVVEHSMAIPDYANPTNISWTGADPFYTCVPAPGPGWFHVSTGSYAANGLAAISINIGGDQIILRGRGTYVVMKEMVPVNKGDVVWMGFDGTPNVALVVTYFPPKYVTF